MHGLLRLLCLYVGSAAFNDDSGQSFLLILDLLFSEQIFLIGNLCQRICVASYWLMCDGYSEWEQVRADDCRVALYWEHDSGVNNSKRGKAVGKLSLTSNLSASFDKAQVLVLNVSKVSALKQSIRSHCDKVSKILLVSKGRKKKKHRLRRLFARIKRHSCYLLRTLIY